MFLMILRLALEMIIPWGGGRIPYSIAAKVASRCPIVSLPSVISSCPAFEAVADNLAHLRKVRILVCRTDRHVLEEVASELQQAPALYARIESEGMIRRGDREGIAQH